MHSLGAFGAWRKKCQTRENLRRDSPLSSRRRLKKERAEARGSGPLRLPKINCGNILRQILRLMLKPPVVASASVVWPSSLQLNNGLLAFDSWRCALGRRKLGLLSRLNGCRTSALGLLNIAGSRGNSGLSRRSSRSSRRWIHGS